MRTFGEYIFLLVVIMHALSSAPAFAQVGGDPAERLLDDIAVFERFEYGDDVGAFREAEVMLASRLRESGSVESVDRLFAVAEDQTKHSTVRMVALRACVTGCNKATAGRVASHLLRWTKKFDDDRAHSGERVESESVQQLYSMIFGVLSEEASVPSLVDIVMSGEDGMRFLRWLLASDEGLRLSRNPGFVILERAPLTSAQKEELALAHVLSSRVLARIHQISPYLSDSVDGVLMRDVRASGKDYLTINQFAVDVLAYRGSKDLRAYLEAHKQQLMATKPLGITERELPRYRRGIEHRIDTWIVMIDLQRSHETLLAYIAGRSFDYSSMWIRRRATFRAIELGIAPERIKGAILEHLSYMVAAQEAADPVEREQMKMAELEFRQAVLPTGLISEDEWPSPIPMSTVRFEQ